MVSILFVVLAVAASFQPSASVLTLPAPFHVITYVSKLAPGSRTLMEMVESVEDDFPSVEFDYVWLEPSEAKQPLPYITCMYEGNEYVYKYDENVRWLRRWIKDAMYGHFTTFETVSVLDTFMDDMYPVYVHMLSPVKPKSIRYTKALPEVGFFWSPVGNRTGYRDTVLIRDVYGQMHQRSNFDFSNLLHVLLPPVIPNKLLDDDVPYIIFSKLARREVTVVSDEPLASWWYEFVQEYPMTAFVHVGSEESNVTTVPSVWFTQRSTRYMLPSVSEDVTSWLQGIRLNTTEPYFRVSTPPVNAHPVVDDLSSNDLWPWLGRYNESVLYVYSGEDGCSLAQHAPLFHATHRGLGRMNISENDHEYFPNSLRSGMYLHYNGSRLIDTAPCETFNVTKLLGVYAETLQEESQDEL